jgi:uncharacterized membrane protein
MLLLFGTLYIVGVVLVTAGYHVPRNNKLNGLDPNSAEEIAYWATTFRASRMTAKGCQFN